ncbi:MAG: hypothetical protein NTY48_05115 [Candidatus Diapherotrites archaeon]|nr:hypothetical protein [Candidatus Diapherotrites archaeon]
MKIKQEKDLVEHDRDISQKVLAEAIRIAVQQRLSPEEAQKRSNKDNSTATGEIARKRMLIKCLL